VAGLERRDLVRLAVGAALVAAAGAARYAGAPSLLAFVVSGVAIAALAHLVGGATEQLGARLGPGGAGSPAAAPA
jgi:Ca2+:H+ antiporter